MSYRFMRIVVFFDLPSVSNLDKRDYRAFRRFLIKSGFIMVQESVYSKLTLNATVANAVVSNVRKNKPTKGLIQVLIITEKQYAKMEFIIGERYSDVIEDDERLLIL